MGQHDETALFTDGSILVHGKFVRLRANGWDESSQWFRYLGSRIDETSAGHECQW